MRHIVVLQKIPHRENPSSDELGAEICLPMLVAERIVMPQWCVVRKHCGGWLWEILLEQGEAPC